MKVKLKSDALLRRHGVSLSPDRVYSVIGIEADDFRILDDAADPVLFPPDMFEIIDVKEPDAWITMYGEDGERYAYPEELHRPGFFADYDKQEPQVIEAFWRCVERLGLKYPLPKSIALMKGKIEALSSSDRELFYYTLLARISRIALNRFIVQAGQAQPAKAEIDTVTAYVVMINLLSSHVLAVKRERACRYPEGILFDLVAEYAIEKAGLDFGGLCRSVLQEVGEA